MASRASSGWNRFPTPTTSGCISTFHEELEKYVVFKGSISIEGISLTVAKLDGLRLTIAIIPHTIKMTNLDSLKPGDPVNIETDIVAKYLEKWTRREDGSPLTVDRLVAQGF